MDKRVCGLTAGVLVVLSVSGCASWTHLTKSKELTTSKNAPAVAQSIIIDAKQRIVTAAPIVSEEGTGAAMKVRKYMAFCAEPSPDALSALAAGGGISLSKGDKLDLATSLSIAEGAGSIGLRTQSIQLMRDSMFRLCEGYMSGALDDLSFQTLHRRFQSSMVAILAIEQLTGAVRAPAVAIGGKSGVGNAELAADLTKKKEAALVSLRQGEDSLKAKTEAAKTAAVAMATAQAALDAEKDEAKKPPLKTKLDEATVAKANADREVTDATTVKNDRAAALNEIEAARAQAIAGGSNATTTVEIKYPDGKNPDAAAIATIADKVATIVTTTLDLNWGPELCASVLLKNPTVAVQGSVAFTCNDYLNQNVAIAKANALTLTSISQVIAKMDSLSPELLKELKNATKQLSDVVMMHENSISSDPVIDEILKKAKPQNY